jgi:hypothetical protein
MAVGEQISMIFTNDEDMGTPVGNSTPYDARQAKGYLDKSPRHAVVLINGTLQIAVFCGASDESNNYFYQELPLEDPNDANGGDLSSDQALYEAWQTVQGYDTIE